MTGNKKLTISVNDIVIFFGFIFLLKPTCLPYIMNGRLNSIYTIIQAGVCVLTLLAYIYRRKINSMIILIVSYFVYQILLTFATEGDLRSILMTSVQFIAISIFADIFIAKDRIKMINILALVLEIYLYINFLTLFMYPDGMYVTISTGNPNNWFLGYKNQIINFLLPALTFSLLNYYYNNNQGKFLKKLRLYGVSACCIITTIIMWSGGTIIIFAIIFAYLIFERFLPARIFNIRNYLIANGALVFGIVVLKVQNLFSFIIVDLLGKDITLTGRIYIWDKVIGYIAENPIFGYGVETYSERLIKMYMGHSSWQNNYAALHSHCRYLETIYRGGIILFGIYLSILILATKKLMQFKNTIYSKIMSISFFAYLTGMMTEWYDYCPMFWVFLVMAFHASSFCANETHLLKKGGNI